MDNLATDLKRLPAHMAALVDHGVRNAKAALNTAHFLSQRPDPGTPFLRNEVTTFLNIDPQTWDKSYLHAFNHCCESFRCSDRSLRVFIESANKQDATYRCVHKPAEARDIELVRSLER